MIPLYTDLTQTFNGGLTQAVSNTVTSALNACAGPLQGALTVFVVIQGALIAFRKYDTYAGMVNCLRAACISLLITGGQYATWIQTPFLTTVPNWIAQVVNGGTGPNAAGQQFDAVFEATVHFESQVLQQATGFFNIGTRAEAAIIVNIDAIALGIAWLMWELGTMMMGLCICIGPFVLVGMLFASTRPIAQRWLSKLVGLLLLDLMIAVLLQVVIAGNEAFIRQAQNAPGNGVEEQLNTLMAICTFAVMSAAVAVVVPAVAAYIGGGVGMNVRPIVTAPTAIFRGRR